MPVPVPPQGSSFVPLAVSSADYAGGPPSATKYSTALVSAQPVVPPEMSIQLLNTLLIFYEQRKGWVQRSRASLELAFVQGPLLVEPSIGRSSDEQSDSDGSAPSVYSSGSSTDEPTPATTDNDGMMETDEPTIKQEEEDDGIPPRTRALVPLTLRAAKPAASSSKWMKRKKSFNLHLGPLRQQNPTRPRRQTSGPEPSARLLELFGDLLEVRMESCLRITRLVRESNRSMLHTW
ncbi:uncharacterized protein FOMMEDRAFT_147943 [Fomitiporia mediterranea MF3/22]|uniref:uncharacterized protein n=1 Tax=Fomitiporia mediterranea (strain MF3/22) TaxID=694068 RepID=UPI0004407EE2|nr:uncharacterized protein FOMMEDRAFT_147943 [Fomitiporia mediterranea MF3/22]EJD01419.1 hypothetical protein FOMMEDRAFT_147943 [Fomitiporia mediterranea MF3/22]